LSKVVKPYQDSGSKKEQVSDMFNNIAHKYDFLNRILSLGIDKIWRRKAINIIKKTNPSRILDVATGTADVAISTANIVKPESIVGVDISKEMLEVGKKKIKNLGLDQTISLKLGDSESLEFEDNYFDAATVAFGVRNFENLEKGLAEMLRVVNSGGTILILELSKPTIFPFKQVFQFYFKFILPIIGKFTSKDPKAYTYLFESVQAFPQGDKFLSIMESLGYKNCREKKLSLGICSIYLGEK
jgi:demethylmenaquinone methyltransferase/2-methoxy-6-polyprenyl-1,4-benzoquinol methylase